MSFQKYACAIYSRPFTNLSLFSPFIFSLHISFHGPLFIYLFIFFFVSSISFFRVYHNDRSWGFNEGYELEEKYDRVWSIHKSV